MFKKGQLVRSLRTGWLHVVTYRARNDDAFVCVRCVSRKTARRTLLVPANEMQLIGNNYKAKG